MATSMAQAPLPNCEICEQNIGRRYCIDCEQYFCKTCEEFHLKSKSCRDHVFQDLRQINPKEKKVKCKEHNENMTYYCTTCSMLVCKICLPNRHTKHDFTLPSEAALKFKTDLEPHIEQMKTVVISIGQQRTTLEGKTNQFINSNERIVNAIKQKGSELKDIVDKIVYGKVANVTTEEQVNLQKKIEEERILKNTQERAEMVLLKVINAVENQGDTMLLNSHQSLQQAIQSMSDITKSDLEFPTLTFEDGSLDEIILTEMIGNVIISKTNLVNNAHGKSRLKQVGIQAGVVTSSNEDEVSYGKHIRSKSTGLDERAVYTASGGQEVIVVKGDITGLDVDVIVNGANRYLNHSDGLAKVLITKGGKSIQDECDQYTRYQGPLSEGECYSSKPGTLKCHMIVHAVGPSWQGGYNREEDLLQKCVKRAIVETEKNKYTTIAIPALCTGIFGYPAHQATRAIAQAVRDYFKRSKTSTVKTVCLCDVNDSSIDLFVKAGDKMFDQGVDGGRRPSGGGNRHSDKAGIQKPKNELIQPSQKPVVDSNTMYSVDIGNLILKVYQGEITAVKVDVIVNGTNTDLDLDLTKGAVANAIRTKGGKELKYQLKSQKKAMGIYGIAVTTNTPSKSFPCGAVIHIDMTDLNSSGHAALNPVTLKDKVKKALKKTDELRKATVAFPALGTSNSNVTTKEAAEQMFKAVEKFNSKPVHYVKEVHVVIFQQQMKTDFMAAIKECVDNSTSNNKGYVRRFLNWFSG
ncbi:Hypothetical predicted protein [Mytilus galloprovincialis]|uniref:Macro domain-containing protein n=1 Tax=Mytilus galloprovincialis TaxID=29158 RepID=A0A8B6D937_MYTGA|nr:Hypothetical predicted protein [Mytilus galloprovincialis]